LTTRKPDEWSGEMLNGIGDSLNDLAIYDHEQDWEYKERDEEDTYRGNLSEDDQPGSVMGTISKTVQQGMESCWQKQIRHN